MANEKIKHSLGTISQQAVVHPWLAADAHANKHPFPTHDTAPKQNRPLESSARFLPSKN
jgi:hypothetical protein